MSRDAEAGGSGGPRRVRQVRVGLARTARTYRGLAPPYSPGEAHPELVEFGPRATGAERPNSVYAGVRNALFALGLDAGRFGTPEWNPLGSFVDRGARIVLKPNFIRHWNPSPAGSVESLVTHGSILRAIADYAFLAVGGEGEVIVAEAPQHDCDFDVIRGIVGLDELVALYSSELGWRLQVIDLRREAVRYQDGVIVERRELSGDPKGYRCLDLGKLSFFHGSGLDPTRFRGADYDPGPTVSHHVDGRHEYLLSETVLSADLVVNLPKWKTHKKTGVTLALKNLVGINGDKNWLPHHCFGSVADGGDEFPGERWIDRARSRYSEIARTLLKAGRARHLARWGRRLETATRGQEFIRSGNWHGNRTTWRMCLDLNRCLYYSDADGLKLDAPEPVRRVLTVLDGVVAGEGEGPLAPRDVPLGVVLAATDPVALDLVAVRLMGYNERSLPKVWEALRAPPPRLTRLRKTSEVSVVEADPSASQVTTRTLDQLEAERVFRPHPGWQGHVERRIR